MTQKQEDGRVVSGCNTPDYAALEIPTKPRTEYSYAERRAELLQQIKDLGHPSLVNQTQEAERYGVTQQQISKDLDRLAEYVDGTLGARRELITEAVFHRAIQGLLEEGEYRDAARTVKDWNEWIDDHRELQELQEQIEEIKARQGGRGQL